MIMHELSPQKRRVDAKKTKSHKKITNKKKRITQELRNIFLDNCNMLLISQLKPFPA